MKRKSRRIRIFESSIERLARILAKRWNRLRVVFKHGECKTDGNTIYLPVLPDDAPKELMDAMQGHLDHEAAHVVYTDFAAVKKLGRKPKTFTTVNAMEDPRIEALWKKMYPGARTNLNRSLEWSLKKVSAEREVEDENGNKVMRRVWDDISDLGKILYASTVFAGVDFDSSHWFLRDVVEPAVMDKVRKHSQHFRDARNAATTGDVVTHAEAFLKALGEDDPETEMVDPSEIEDDAIVLPPGQGVSPQDQVMRKPSGDQEDGPKVYQMAPSDGEGEEGEEGEGESQELPGAEGSAGGGQDSDKDNSGSGLNLDPSQEELDRDSQLLNQSDQIREAARREVTGTDSYLVYTTEGDIFQRIDGNDRIAYKRFMQDAVRIVAPMKRRLSRSLLATAVSRWENDKTRGKINPRRVYQVKVGTSKRVFRQRVEAESFDTAVLLMIDHSGSMWGSQLDLAAQTSCIFGELLNQLNIPFSILGFSTGSGSTAYQRQASAAREEKKVYSRWGNLWIGEYKSFDDNWQQAGPRVITMAKHGQHNTYDGESLKYGAQVLLNRPEKRKILFWLNDGYPCPNPADNSEAHWEYAHACAKEVEKKVELFALGINAPDIKRIYSNCVVISAIQDLPKACLLELDAMLRQGKSLKRAA